MRTVLITGASGQDGAYLARLLLNQGHQVRAMARTSDPGTWWRFDRLGISGHENLRILYGDVTDSDFVNWVFKNISPDDVYHLASQSSVGMSWRSQRATFETNFMGTLNILNAVRDICPDASVVNASTGSIYGSSNVAVKEGHAYNPTSPYAMSKLAPHHLCQSYRKNYGIDVSNAIFFNHASELSDDRFVMKKIS